MKKNYVCSNCKEQIISDDAGWGHKFTKGQDIFCKKKPKFQGSLHYCSESEMDDCILETARGEADFDRKIRSYGKPAKVLFI